MEFKQYLIEANKKHYEFSSTQFNLPENLSQEIKTWSLKELPENDLYQMEGYGRETEFHVTILYGLHDDTPTKLKRLIYKLRENEEIRPFSCTLGKMSVFNSKPDFDVLKLEVESPELHRLNRILSNSLEFSNDYPTYQPHVTIAYVKKDKGNKFKLNSAFNGKKFLVDKILFSDKNRKKISVPLN